MSTFTTEVNRINDQVYTGLNEYNALLKQSLNLQTTVNNPLGSTCHITFGSLNMNFNFFNLPFQKSPLNFKLFQKFQITSDIVADINSVFIKMIEDLNCCDLAKNYNNNILPLFMWFVGDAGDSYGHPAQFDSSRKSSGFLPIMIEVAKGLMEAYEPVKALTCIIRPVPGNPWMDAGGVDFLKPVYNVMSELDYVMKTILNGDYLDILIEPIKHFRDQAVACNGKNRSQLQFVDQYTLTTDNAVRMRDLVQQLTTKYASSINLKSTKPPEYSPEYYQLKDQIEKLINDRDKWSALIIEINKQLSDLDIEKTNTLNGIEKATKDQNNATTTLATLNSNDPTYSTYQAILTSAKSRISNLQTVMTNLNTKETDLKNQLDTYQSNMDNNEYTNLKNKFDHEVNNYEVQLALYQQYLDNTATTLNAYKDCTLLTKTLMGVRTDNSCNCLLSMLNIFVPVPEFAEITSEADVASKLIGRLPYSLDEISNYRKNDYTLINSSNINEKLPGSPSFLYPGVTWRNQYTGVLPSTQMTPTMTAQDFYDKMEAATTFTEAINISTLLSTYRKETANKKLKVDLELSNEVNNIIDALKTLKIQKTNELIQISSINESTAFMLDYTKQSFTPSIDENGNTIYSKSTATRVQLKQDLLVIDDLLAFPTIDYLVSQADKISTSFNIPVESIINMTDLDSQSRAYDKTISDFATLIKLNTRVVTILSKDNIPCDCNIICRLIQYIVDTIIGAIKDMFNRIVDMILNSVMTKEMAYILRFVRAKLQCVIDILAIPDNISIISKRAQNLIDEMQMKLRYASEPAFCLNTNSTPSPSNSVIPVNPTTITDIQKPLINYNVDGTNYGEQYFNNNGVDSTTAGAYPYPNVSGGVKVIDPVTINNNHLIIKNVIPGQQYEFRNIPTLFFDCNIPDPSLRPVFDIVTETAPAIWSCYFSFQLTPEKLNHFTNHQVFEQITSSEQQIKDLVLRELNTDITPSLTIWDDLDVQSVIDAAKVAATTTIPDQFKKKVQECTTSTVLTETGTSTCGYDHLEIVSVELMNPAVNNLNFNFVLETAGINIYLKEDISRFNIPIKVKVKKKLDNSSTVVFDEYNPEQVSVILLLDFYSSTDEHDPTKETYNKKPQFDANLFYGRYPYLEIGYREYGVGGIYHLPGDIITNYLDFGNIISLCDVALANKKAIDATKYQPTQDQIDKRSSIIQDRWEQNPCYLPNAARDAIENNKETINNLVKPLLLDFTTKLKDKTEWIITQTPVIDNSKVQQLTTATQKTIEYGIPLLELDKDKKICVQIIQVKTIENGIDVYKPMVNISNFNFLSDLLNFNDNNNIPMFIIPNATYFLSITFDGSKYQFTLIDENKVIASLTKLKTTQNSLFPTRFGRMTNQELVDQTFCGTLFDFGVANTVIDPALYYKYSMLSFNPHSEVFIDFETNINNNFYSSSDLPTTSINSISLSPEVRSYLEQTYLKEYGQTDIPYFIYNKYISAQPMNSAIVVEGNKFKNALKESFITNFFCKESIKNRPFTISFWFKRIQNEFISTNPKRMVLVSDTKFFNNFYYDDTTVEFVLELNNKAQVIKIPLFLQVGVWNNFIIKFDHLLNRLVIFITDENQNELHQIYIGTLDSQFQFNLISMLAEFDFNKKAFTNYFPCLFGNLIIDTQFMDNKILQERFPAQKLAFKGL